MSSACVSQRRVLSWPGRPAAFTSIATTSSPRPRLSTGISAVVAPSSAPSVAIKEASGNNQLQQVAVLRADAYYAEERSRFVESFKKQFVAQELESLLKRTVPSTTTGVPQCECLVALGPSPDEVLGCIDIRLPFSQTGSLPAGVPPDDTQGAYILNVVVHEDHRGQGIGRALMHAAMHRAISTWQAQALYTHVEADNEVAYKLYTQCGFKEFTIQSKYASSVMLGQLVLLRAAASDFLNNGRQP